MKSERFLRIGELGKMTGIHPNTIRRLESRGLLNPARDWAGHRRFSEADVHALQRLVERPSRDPAPE